LRPTKNGPKRTERAGLVVRLLAMADADHEAAAAVT